MSTTEGQPPGASETMPSQFLCDRCNNPGYIDEATGKMHCSGCGMPNDRCKCVNANEPQSSPGV